MIEELSKIDDESIESLRVSFESKETDYLKYIKIEKWIEIEKSKNEI